MPEPQDSLTHQLDDLVDELEMSAARPGRSSRRRSGGAVGEGTELQLVEREGVLHVEQGTREALAAGSERRRSGRGAPVGVVKWRKELATLERSRIGEWLEALDKKLTPHQGLRRLHEHGLVPAAAVPSEGRVLLLVHGTFSNSESFFEGWRANPVGDDWMRWANHHYDSILAFDHPTLAVSPMLNARRLGLLFQGSEADVDVIAHSRGGLVTRWWLDAFDHGPAGRRRAVLVGSPLAGTGLAAPPNIKGTLGLLSNIARALGTASAAVPFLTVMTGVFRVVSSVTKLAAKTPAVDAALALVPGLTAQSRVGNARELLSLRESPPRAPGTYFAVRSNFESERIGWQFWRHFRTLGDRTKDVTADLVFDGDNDLVVDTGSMAELSRDEQIPDDQLLDFGTTDRVHHTNYFEQRETVDFLGRALGTPDG